MSEDIKVIKNHMLQMSNQPISVPKEENSRDKPKGDIEPVGQNLADFLDFE
jgi:hypothetical protein